MKKLIVLIIGILSFYSLAHGANNLKQVSIIQTIAHPALDQTYKGIIDELSSQGFIDNETVKINFSIAQGDPSLSNQIAQKFVSKNSDIIVAIGTTSSQSAMSATRKYKLPIIFSSVTDPIDAGLLNNLNQPEKNITGVSNSIELDQQLFLFKKIIPSLTKLGFIYNPGENNSVRILQLLKDISKSHNIEIITSVASRTSEISTAANKLINKVDAIFVSNDNTALSAFGIITKLASKNKIPIFVSDTDIVKNGALASLGPNQYQIGRQTGKMIISNLNGKSIHDMPVEFPKNIELIINQKIAKDLGVIFPEDIISQANEILR